MDLKYKYEEYTYIPAIKIDEKSSMFIAGYQDALINTYTPPINWILGEEYIAAHMQYAAGRDKGVKEYRLRKLLKK